MRYHVLATDYDETLAIHGRIRERSRQSLRAFSATGRHTLLVTGRELDDLINICDCLDLFEWVVAENGAVLYNPKSREIVDLESPPPASFIEALSKKDIHPLCSGRVIVSTREPHQTIVLDTIRKLGLELHVIFNKGAVMVLPSSVNKASGLMHALKRMSLSLRNVIGVGDAENDHSFLSACELSAAVSNALPSLKEKVDLLLEGGAGVGVEELVELVVSGEIEKKDYGVARHRIAVGADESGEAWGLSPHGGDVLIAGSPAAGKSSAATVLLEGLIASGYQFCVLDPEGDYGVLPGAVVFGSSKRAPDIDEIIKYLEDPSDNAVVNLVGVRFEDRPEFLHSLVPRLQELHIRLGHPHWLIVDEAHHVLPAAKVESAVTFGRAFFRTMFITVRPKEVLASAISAVETVMGAGDLAETALKEAAAAIGAKPPKLPKFDPASGSLLTWPNTAERSCFLLNPHSTKSERKRHTRKYAEGELSAERSFYFRGSERKLNLRAQNLMIFLQIAEGIDEQTWMHHLRRHDFSSWFETEIKDEELAREAYAVESDPDTTHAQSVERIGSAIRQRFTLPAEAGKSGFD